MKINTLKLYSANFEAQVAFYNDKLGIPLLNKNTKEASFKLGKSILTLKKSVTFQPYHFAINIPSNQINEALTWLKERVTILKDENNEIQHFKNWSAKAIYFYDEDKNIVEFIARENLHQNSDALFTSKSLVEISEIGVPTTNIESIFNSITKFAPLKKYDGNFERFCAIGNENGLFICINKNIKDWFPINDPAYTSDFEIDFQEHETKYRLQFKNGETIKML